MAKMLRTSSSTTRIFDDASAGLSHYRWQAAPARITDHKCFRPAFNFGSETVSVKPIDANQQVKLIRKTVDGIIRQAKQTCGLTTSNLRA